MIFHGIVSGLPVRTCLLLVLFVGVSLCIELPGLTQEPNSTSDEPPSLEEVIENVRKHSRPLKRAVVELKPHRGAGDGGGRLYWRRGTFVRSKTYRIGRRGTVDLYDVVSDTSSRTFLFHTNKSGGESFTLSLRMPYETASKTGYGLSDHYFLEYVADRRFDFKYGQMLMSLQLFPEQLRTFGDRYDISYVERDGTRYVRLRRHKTMFKSFYFTEDLFINPSTWRFERIELEDQRRFHHVEVVGTQTVQGVTLPAQVRITSPQYEQSLPYVLSYDVRAGKQLDQRPKKPNWLQDPAIPEVSELSTRKIHQTLKKDASGDLYQDLMQAAIRYRYMLGPTHFHPKAFQKSVDIARRQHPRSRLLRAYKDGIASKTKITEEDMYVTSFPSMKQRVIIPYMNYAAAYRSLRAGDPERADRYMEPIRDRYPFNRIAERFDDYAAVTQASSAVEFFEAMKQVADTPVYRHASIVPPAVRTLHHHTSWVEDLEQLAEKRSSVILDLVLALYYRRKDRFKQANRHYRNIASVSYLQPELHSYLRKAGFRARWLLDRFSDDVTRPGLLLRLALKHFQEGHQQRALSVVKRTIRVLKHPRKTNPGALNAGDQTVGETLSDLTTLLERLREGEHSTLIHDLMTLVIDRYNVNWNQRTELLETLESSYSGGAERTYRITRYFVKTGWPEIGSRFLDMATFRSRLLSSVQGDEVEEEDLKTLAQAIVQGVLTKEDRIRQSVPVLEDARDRFESTGYHLPGILLGLGDACHRLKRYGRAASVYQEFLSLVLNRHHPKFYARPLRSVSTERIVTGFSGNTTDVQHDDPVLLKLTDALVQSGEKGKDVTGKIRPYFRLHRAGLTPALALLLTGDRKRARRHLLLRFYQEKNKNIGKRLMMALGGIFRERERYGAAALIYDMGIRRLKIKDKEVKQLYRSTRRNIDQDKLINTLKEQEYGSASPKTRRFVNRKLDELKREMDRKKTMKLVSKVMNSQRNVVPVLLEKVDASSPKVRELVRKMLETIRMRQIYRELFEFSSIRSRF